MFSKHARKAQNPFGGPKLLLLIPAISMDTDSKRHISRDASVSHDEDLDFYTIFSMTGFSTGCFKFTVLSWGHIPVDKTLSVQQ